MSLKHTITITMLSSITCNKSKHQKATQIVYKKALPFTTNCHIFVFFHIRQLTTLLQPITVSFALNLCHTTTFTHEHCVRSKALNWTKHLSPLTLNITITFLLTINFVPFALKKEMGKISSPPHPLRVDKAWCWMKRPCLFILVHHLNDLIRKLSKVYL